MPTVGEQLRSARERLNLTIHQVADSTKIKTDHIRALEDSNWKTFSAPVYIRGFVRSYAGHLKLDVPRVVQELETELARTRDYAEPPSLTGSHRGPLDFVMLQISRVKWQLVIPLILVLVVGGAIYYGILALRTSQPKGDPYSRLGNGLYRATTLSSQITLPLPTNSPVPRR
ncbi:MAG: hypothetical protein EXS36_06185 [Pedosphaera sp.]|nr:hypothetical protein [Pedosphaera sp.]